MMRSAVVALSLLALAGCSTSKLKPASLTDLKPTASLAAVWSVEVPKTPTGGSGEGAFAPAASGGLAVVAAPSGDVQAFALDSGASRWRVGVGAPLAAGVGFGGGSAEGRFAVITRDGELVLIDDSGSIRWRVPIGGVSHERPALSGGLVVVRLADNRLAGFDLETGSRRWIFQRTMPSLALHGQSGVRGAPSSVEAISTPALGTVDAVVTMPAGRMVWVNAATGAVRWEAQVATPKGSNEVERIADLLGLPAVQGEQVCVAAYQNQVACLQSETGRVLWRKNLAVGLPVAVDVTSVYAVDASSRVFALDAKTGAERWKTEAFFLRRLTTPVSVGQAVWVADFEGYLHGLARETGAPIGRVRLEGGRPSGPMLLTRGGLLIQTEGGRLSLLKS
jgi:outer membrane protein assembly factor BamB